MSKTTQCCLSCRHGKFERTEKGNLVRHRAGRCYFPTPVPTVPSCVRFDFSRIAIWPKDGGNCECWEAFKALAAGPEPEVTP